MSERVEVRNASDPEQVSKAKEKEIRGRELELNDFAWLTSAPQGKRIIWRYLEITGVHKLSYSGESHAASDFNEGMRNVGLRLMADLMESNPQAYIDMITANKKEDK
jgi:hypothetical protein